MRQFQDVAQPEPLGFGFEILIPALPLCHAEPRTSKPVRNMRLRRILRPISEIGPIQENISSLKSVCGVTCDTIIP
jgi:hypothetical protein